MGPAPSKDDEPHYDAYARRDSNTTSPSRSNYVPLQTLHHRASATEHQIPHEKRLAKRQIEVYYRDFFSLYHDRERAMAHIDNEAHRGRIDELTRLRLRKEQFMRELQYIRRKRKPISISNYHIIRKIGQGSFGEVFLVRDLFNGELYAMKKLRKTDMIYKRQVNHVWLERFVLASVGEHPLVVKMHYSFQDQRHLYFVMEYVPGGDMMTMLIRREHLPEPWARFYIAELVVAIDALHRTGIIHRDIKPDNILFRKDGHICLSDFGLSKSLMQPSDRHRFASSGAEYVNTPNFIQHIRRGDVDLPLEKRIRLWKALAKESAFSRVGTPNYIAPEVLQGNSYSESCDWWSVGVILFEMLVGYPPFCHRDPECVGAMICHWRQYLRIPKEIPSSRLSNAAKHLIYSLLREAPYRLGARRGLQEFKEHRFFEGIDWDTLSDTPAPFIPNLKSDTDTRYFEDDITRQQVVQPHLHRNRRQNADNTPQKTPRGRQITRKRSLKLIFDRNTDVEFVGFTYVPRSVDLIGPRSYGRGPQRDLYNNSAPPRADQRSSVMTDALSLEVDPSEARARPLRSPRGPVAEAAIANAEVSTVQDSGQISSSRSTPRRLSVELSAGPSSAGTGRVRFREVEEEQSPVPNDDELPITSDVSSSGSYERRPNGDGVRGVQLETIPEDLEQFKSAGGYDDFDAQIGALRVSEEDVGDETQTSAELGRLVDVTYSPTVANRQSCLSLPDLETKHSQLSASIYEDVQEEEGEGEVGTDGAEEAGHSFSECEASSSQEAEGDDGEDGIIRRMSRLVRDEDIPVFSTDEREPEPPSFSAEEASEFPNESEVNPFLYEASRGMNNAARELTYTPGSDIHAVVQSAKEELSGTAARLGREMKPNMGTSTASDDTTDLRNRTADLKEPEESLLQPDKMWSSKLESKSTH
ncbi:Serine/threonine protein kinase Nuclear [Gracilaria domingensis]|nr:Serine/threonine protein kinase Nuclear [Gracilaria domingensis]